MSNPTDIADNPPVASLRDISLRYKKTWALADITLDFPKGRVTGLIGPDGVGKSSVLALVSGARALQAGRLELDLPDEAAGRAMVDLEVLRAVQLAGLEALHNVARHAEASWARLALVREDARSWSLIVEDDGKGIPDDPDTPTDGGNGLPSLRARAESIGARVTLTRRPEGGTRVRLRFHPRRGWLGGWR